MRLLKNTLNSTLTPDTGTPGTVWHPLVILGGLLTTGLALLLVSITNILGWYAFHAIPAGALLVGALAGGGYGLVSYWTGTKIARGMLWLILAIQLCSYFLANYLQFRLVQSLLPTGTTFWQLYDQVTRSFELGLPPHPIGALGYGIRALELSGYLFGGLIAPGLLRSLPFCERCQKYRKSVLLTQFNASATLRKVNERDPDDKAAYVKEWDEAEAAAKGQVDAIVAQGKSDNLAGFAELIAQQKPRLREIGAVVQTLHLSLVYCPACYEGYLQTDRVEVEGRNTKPLLLERTDVAPHFIQAALAARKEKRL